MIELAQKITDHSEKQARNQVDAPQYGGYHHIRFWGNKFPPELTYSQHGFIIRRYTGMSLIDITQEIQKLFPGISNINLFSINQLNQMPAGYNADILHHDIDDAVVTVQLNMTSMNQDYLELYNKGAM